MIRLVALLLLAAPSCRSNVRAPATPARHGSFSGYRMLADGSYHPHTDLPPWGFYVVGNLHDGLFIPTGDIEGRGELGETGTFGWLELGDGSFHAALPAANTPQRPYITGYLSLEATFAPSSHHINQ